MDNPRELALEVLVKIDKKEELSHIAIGDVLEKYQLSPKRDRGFFTRLVEGTLERQITIDYVINQFSKTKINKCKPVIRALLRMGVYQILYMDQVPDSAACNEAVKLAKKKGFQRLSGFVNGVLRSISRGREEIKYPKKDPVFSMSINYSIPQWIVEFLLETYDQEIVEKIVQSYIEETKTTICQLQSKGSKEDLVKQLEEAQVTVTHGALVENALYISDYDSLYHLKPFRQGLFSVQDESSMLAAKLADAKEGQTVLDMCSAPGGKAIYMADQMNQTGRVIARDLSEYKADFIEDNLDRIGFTNVDVQVFDARVLDEDMLEVADVVLADLPCSGLGIMGRKNDIKYNISMEGMDQLVALQREILANAVKYVKPGGTLIYSTCTINPKENEENFQWLLDNFDLEPVDITEELPKELQIETAPKGYIQLLPGVHPCDGFFVGKLRRR